MSDDDIPDFLKDRRPVLVSIFERYAARKLGAAFHRVRCTGGSTGFEGIPATTPIVLYGNHASWWDPLLAMFLRRHCFPRRVASAPIDQAMLDQYGIFKRLGFFGVDRSEPSRAARQFLRDSRAALVGENRMLFLTPQGRFVDVRERPVVLESGLAHLLKRQPEIYALPMAIEYVFWEESRPELLLHLGEPVTGDPAAALEAAQDHLAERSIARATECFQNLLVGRSGANVFYDCWQRLQGKKTHHSDL